MDLKTILFCCTITAMPIVFGGCTKHEVDIKPVEIKPIHITIDVNVKVDRALDDFFGDLDEIETE
ncbi:YnbE family lipoprotein [Desulfopila sp. IMCC35008]|uniref:YnbE family lipoprotein n=1 Tax=Desulfopila sp. IMCC35008 TaxID=2653858 RepID=UPI0013D392F1|nr:YnbE family lipoprotein [Desulfopila sp. IMCC35008]